MMRWLGGACLAVLVAAGLPARAETVWEIDPVHSSVQFSIRHLMVSNVRGEFRKVAGTVRGDPGNPAGAVIEATIDAASIDTRDAKRDEHLRSADFLDVERHPTITFRSTRIEPAGNGRWRVTGDLALHGVTRAVVLEVEGPSDTITDPRGSIRAGAHATTKIDRRDFGITWSKTFEGGGLVVGNEVRIVIDVEAIRK